MPDGVVSTRLWLRLPCRAIRVRATLDGIGESDLLRETLLRILRIRGFTLDELDEILGGLGHDTIEAALERLALELLVIRPSTPAGVWTSEKAGQSSPPPEIVGGWIVVAPHDGQPVPSLWLAANPPREHAADEGALMPNPVPRPPRGDDRNVQRMLTALNASRTPARVQRSGAIARRSLLPERTAGTTARALHVEDRATRRWRKADAWVPVSFMRRVSGDATFVVHRPQLEPRDPIEGSVDDALNEWIRTEYPAAWEALTAHARRLADDSSIIRKLLGIESEEELDRIVNRHFNAMVRAHDLPPRGGDHIHVEEQVRLAHRWLALASRDAKYHQQARDAFGHAIELLFQVLARFERDWLPPLLRRIVADDDNRARGKEYSRHVEERLRAFGLAGRLFESEKYLTTATPKEVLRELDAGRLGAGSALTVWLVPLGALDHVQAAAFAEQIHRMLGREPQLFEILDILVRVRNDVFHQSRDSRLPPFVQQPDRIDEHFFRAWSAILHGRASFGSEPPAAGALTVPTP